MKKETALKKFNKIMPLHWSAQGVSRIALKNLIFEIFNDKIKEKIKIYKIMQIKCGDANPKGNVALTYKGGCGKELDTKNAYRCTGCGGWFHLDCILKHFKLEKEHDFGRNALKKEIINIINNTEPGYWSNPEIINKINKLN